ncbi:MFS transporter [Ruminococcaceae bacterium OttesenSCG-928-I18]|nr:MFS transporter [Ruminococcaceae bacterium OttesenSCG-928-I18]
MEEKKKSINKLSVVTILIVLGIFFLYIAQMNPSAVLTQIMADLSINMAQGGMGISIIFVPIIICSLIGPYILAKLGLKNTFIVTLIIGGGGILLYLLANSYMMLLVSRVLYGIGYGLGVPFIGAAIMHWYTPKQQVTMNTINALFPYIANLIVYGLTIPMMELFNGSWKWALAIWGILCFAVLIFWVAMVKNEGPISAEVAGEVSSDKNVYLNLIKRKEIIILIIAFVCDFISYSVVSGLLPTYYEVEAGYSPEMANNLTLIFPFAGIAGGLFAFWYMARSGKRKGLLVLGQAMKAVGIALFYFGGASALGFIGVGLIGMGNCIWIPAMYQVPLELERMTPTLVGAAFALITSCGFAMGFVAPALAGWMGDNFTLRLAIFLCAFPCLIGMVACLLIRETGPGRKNKEKTQ